MNNYIKDYITKETAQKVVKNVFKIHAISNERLPSEENIDIYMKCMEAIKYAPSSDIIPKSIYEQTKWERDFAEKRADDMSQLIRNKDVVKVVRCENCEHKIYAPYVHRYLGYVDAYNCKLMEGYECKFTPDHFCAYGDEEED